LLSSRGFDTPSLQAQGGQRRPSYFNKLRDIPSNLAVSIHFFEGEGKTFDFRPHLGRIVCPTLIIGGAKDPRCPPIVTRMFADGIRASLLRLEMFEACGHGPHIEEPERVMALLRHFIVGT
jgi:pimeloyl-ACP methyl ester carboxylesterase